MHERAECACGTELEFHTDGIGHVSSWCPQCKSGGERPAAAPAPTPVELREVGWFLRRTRVDRGLTRRDFCDTLGISVPTLVDIEHGRTRVRAQTIAKLQSALHIVIVRPGHGPLPPPPPVRAVAPPVAAAPVVAVDRLVGASRNAIIRALQAADEAMAVLRSAIARAVS